VNFGTNANKWMSTENVVFGETISIIVSPTLLRLEGVYSC